MENTRFTPKFTVERNPQTDTMQISLDKVSAGILIEATSYEPCEIESEYNLRMLRQCREILRKLAFTSLNVKVPELEDPSKSLYSLTNSI